MALPDAGCEVNATSTSQWGQVAKNAISPIYKYQQDVVELGIRYVGGARSPAQPTRERNSLAREHGLATNFAAGVRLSVYVHVPSTRHKLLRLLGCQDDLSVDRALDRAALFR